MTHTVLKVYIESYTPEPGGTVQVTSVKNDGAELKRHTFPAGVVKDFEKLVHTEAQATRIEVLTDYVVRHELLKFF